MSEIRNRPPGSAPSEPLHEKAAPTAADDKRAGKAARAAANPEPEVSDQFVRAPAGPSQSLEARLQPLSGQKIPAAHFRFNDKDLEVMANAFAAIVSEFPNADRKQRAKRFAEAILRRKRLKKLVDGMSDGEISEMCDFIGEMLDSSPVFGQSVDDVTEGVRKPSSS